MKLKSTFFKSLSVFVVAIFISNFALAQTSKTGNYKSKVTSSEANFFEIVSQKRAEFAQLDLTVKANKKAQKQFERWAYIWQDKVNADGTFPGSSNRMVSKEAYINTMMDSQIQTKSSTNPWIQVGPVETPLSNGYVGYPGKGRINVIAEDPNNENIMYAGSAAGGVWKTTNNGALWLPKSDFLAGLGVTDILVDPNNTSIIYMATGDEDGAHISSIGVFKSIDAGDTWSPTGLTFSLNENEFINDLAFAPGSSTTIYALTTTEIKKTTDAGITWANIPVSTGFGPYTEGFQNIVFDPNDTMKVVVSDSFGGLYFSNDGGSTFSLHSTIQGLSSGQQKLKLASSANDPDFFYGILEEQNNGETITEQATFRKFRYAYNDTAADLVSTTTLTGFSSQGGYNINIAVSPTNKMNILVAGVNGYKSTNGGATFSMFMDAYEDDNTGLFDSFYIHADHHHISFLADGDTVLNGHDAGIHKGPFSTTDVHPLTPWADISSSLIITQPYNISVTQEAMGDNFMMANQDNDGFSKILQGGNRNWLAALAGDGTASGIDISNSDIRYLGGTNGQLYRADAGYADGYDQATYILPTNSDAAFVSQMSVHPSDATIIYACHSDIKKSSNKGGTGDTSDWVALGSGLTETKFIEVVWNDSDDDIEIYTIGNVGNTISAKVTLNDGDTWTTITPPAGQVFNSFSAIPASSVVYATTSGYNDGNKVYKSTNNGVTWTNISSNLPNIIMKKIKVNVDNETAYLGTELGPYFKESAATTWEKLGTGLPNVRVEDLEINYTDNKLYIGTFGRGMWGIEMAERCAGATKIWNGTAWSPAGAPQDTDTVIINGDYNTSNGSIDACTLTISGTSIVTVAAGDYIFVQHAAIVDAGATLNIEHEGSFVQVAEDAKVTNNGTINVDVTTPNLKPRDFMILGNPMSLGKAEGQTNPVFRVLNITTTNFRPHPTVQANFPGGTNFVDEDNNDWSNYSGNYNAGEGYYVWPQADLLSGNQTYDLKFSEGTLNSGEITYNLDFNTTGTGTGTAAENKNASPSVLSNPYPSAIVASDFIATNSAIDEIYLWEHVSTPAPSFPGANTANFNMADISTFNGTMFNPASTKPGATLNNSISTGQGFGVKANAAGTATFNNAMRSTTSNNTLRAPETEINKIWLRINNEQYDLSSTTGIAFTDQATSGYEAKYDSRRVGVPVSIFSHILDGTEELGIQGRESFSDNMQVGIGFSTQIDALESYTISIHKMEGNLISQSRVFLIDHVANTVTDLNKTNYSFESTAGAQNNRFTLDFRGAELSVSALDESAISVFPNPTDGMFTINSPQAQINKVTITDVQGRIITTVAAQNRNAITVDLSGLKAALYFVNISTTQGDLVKQFIKK